MEVKIAFDGMEISVPLEALGDAVAQLKRSQAAPTPVTPQPRALEAKQAVPGSTDRKVNADPVPLPQLSAESQSEPLRLPPLPPLVTAVAQPKDMGPARAFLQLLDEHKVSGGVSPEEVQRVLGAIHPKGIGSRMGTVNNVLRAAGVNPNDVYSNARRDPGGKRIWSGGPKLKEALDRLTPDIKEQSK